MKALAPIVLPPLSALYGAISKARLSLYQRGALNVSRLDAKVVSVGNLTTGGTGKTPLVEWLAQTLHDDGRRICILTRGYGRSNAKRRVIVSDGSRVMATPEEAGDEPFLLATNLVNKAAVVSDPDRVAAGRWAISEFGIDTFILDDGFQHLRLHRDLNILAIDATNPWGGGQLLPYGRLREPLSGVARADCILLTRTEHVEDAAQIVRRVESLCPGRPVFLSKMIKRRFTPANPENPTMAFCGVGNPDSFFQQLRTEGLELAATRVFPDHHPYSGQDVESLTVEAKQAGARSLVTTAKDAVKLTTFDFELPCHVLEIEIGIENDIAFRELLRKSLL
jgi:tetraacyldisaccharide 4'-kinase